MLVEITLQDKFVHDYLQEETVAAIDAAFHPDKRDRKLRRQRHPCEPESGKECFREAPDPYDNSVLIEIFQCGNLRAVIAKVLRVGIFNYRDFMCRRDINQL